MPTIEPISPVAPAAHPFAHSTFTDPQIAALEMHAAELHNAIDAEIRSQDSTAIMQQRLAQDEHQLQLIRSEIAQLQASGDQASTPTSAEAPAANPVPETPADSVAEDPQIVALKQEAADLHAQVHRMQSQIIELQQKSQYTSYISATPSSDDTHLAALEKQATALQQTIDIEIQEISDSQKVPHDLSADQHQLQVVESRLGQLHHNGDQHHAPPHAATPTPPPPASAETSTTPEEPTTGLDIVA